LAKSDGLDGTRVRQPADWWTFSQATACLAAKQANRGSWGAIDLWRNVVPFAWPQPQPGGMNVSRVRERLLIAFRDRKLARAVI